MSGTAVDRTLAEPQPQVLDTRSGMRVRTRPVTVHDGPALADLFGRLGLDDLRFRFLTGLNRIPDDQIAAMIEVDHRHAEHLLAFDVEGGELVASMLIVADEAMENAEVAIVVAQAFRDRGIGWALLRHAADLAKARGLRRLCSVESRANHAALEVERTLGFSVLPCEGDATLVLVEARFD